MRYAISYVSTSATSLLKDNITDIFTTSSQFNIKENITGFLIYSDGNFLQFLEGEKENIIKLYSKIEKDLRHKNLIKFIEKPVSNPYREGYICDFKTVILDNEEEQINIFRKYLQVLDPSARAATERVLETIFL